MLRHKVGEFQLGNITVPLLHLQSRLFFPPKKKKVESTLHVNRGVLKKMKNILSPNPLTSLSSKTWDK